MTTRIHIVNFGPDGVDVATVNPETNEVINATTTIYTQQSTDVYVHSGQAVKVSEVKPKENA